MEYYTLIRHQSFVAALGTRNLPLRLVYGHILGYTLRKGAWQGDVKELASQIELPIQTVRDQLKILTNKGLLTIDGNSYTAAVPQNTATVLTDTRAVPNNTATVQPQTPINYINKEMERDINARANMRDAIPQNPSFLDLKSLFLSKGGKSSDINEPKALEAWNQATPIKRRRLLEAVQSGAHFKRCLDWLIADFPEPQPEFLSGAQQEQNWKDGIPMVQVKVGNRFLICTSQTQQEFNLPLVKPWLERKD